MKTKPLLLLSLLSTSVYAYGACNKCEHSHIHAHQHVPVTSNSGVYVQGNIGAAFPGARFDGLDATRFKPAALFGAGIGYNFSESLSADIGVTHRYKFQYEDVTGVTQNLSSTSIMLSGYYTFVTKTVSPYLAVGAGMAFHDVGNIYKLRATEFTNGKKVNSFAWQIGTGIKFKALDNVLLDLGYRYVDSGSFKSSSINTTIATGATTPTDPASGKLRTHEVSLGVRYNF